VYAVVAIPSPWPRCAGLTSLPAGVCALNIEAMGIMKRGTPPAGANPFPTTVPALQQEPPAPPAAPQPAGDLARGSMAPPQQEMPTSDADLRGKAGSLPVPPPAAMPSSSATGITSSARSAAMSAPAMGSGRPPVAITRAAPAEPAGPALRETAQSFYQRPAVTVTRGVGNEAPKPRVGPPLPIVRQL
jgi:hypothetical protein